MLVGLAALGISLGVEVITTPMIFCSTVNVIEHLGAMPVNARQRSAMLALLLTSEYNGSGDAQTGFLADVPR